MQAETIRNQIDQQCRDSWHGPIGEERAARVRELLDSILPEYSAALGMSEDEVLIAIESKRDYNAVGYYQEANFPKLGEVVVFNTPVDFKATFPSGKYVCPSCHGHSTDPYQCNAGTKQSDGVCKWKSYGLLGTMGKGLRAVVKSTFLDAPKVHEIFMPVEGIEWLKPALHQLPKE